MHRHPTHTYDFSRLFTKLDAARARGLRIFRLFVSLYFDAYGLFIGKQIPVNAAYVTLGNESFEELQTLDSLVALGKFPKGVDQMDCMSGS